MTRSIAVCLHDVSPRTLEPCRRIREWLSVRGAHRITLLVIPCDDGAALRADDPCAAWVRARVAAGDAVAQHGFDHRRSCRSAPWRDWIADRQGGAAAEFVGLDARETTHAVLEGRRILGVARLAPMGFVAPAYAYTPVLRATLREHFAWHAGLLAVHRPRGALRTPAHGLGTSTHMKRWTSPPLLRLGACFPTSVLRLDVHPADFDLDHHVCALDRVLTAHRGRAVTYDELTS